MTAPLAGRTALITGGSLGIGLAIAEAYVRAGASVLVCARDRSEVHAAADRLQARTTGTQRVLGVPCDVTDPTQVEQLVARLLNEWQHLDILVNSAGVYGPKGGIEEVDWQQWCRAIEINLMGSVLPCRAVLPHFRGRRGGKIVQLSGGGATNPLPNLSSYAAAKAAIVRFVETLAVETLNDGIDVNAIAPGAVNTRLLDEILGAGPDAVGKAFYARSLKQRDEGGAPPEKAADLAVFLASSASDGITGRLLSALWDDWKALPANREQLATSDIYTLRRITPEDRGISWTGPNGGRR
jgi:NAD(P)-dependent dehydrogenase (short-subunit alcohol dehydrogenase family)